MGSFRARSLQVLAASGALLAAPVPIAVASTVSVAGSEIQIVAAPGETNVLSFAQNNSKYVVTDTAGVTAGPGCTGQGTSVTCTVQSLDRLSASLGDRDDRFDGSDINPYFDVLGGDGNDALAGGANADRLNGGAGDDFLDGGEGDENGLGDRSFCGLGNDTYINVERPLPEDCEVGLN